MELVDTGDLKSPDREVMRVRPPHPAPFIFNGVVMKEKILSAMRPHFCSRDGCGQVPNPRHDGCVEIDSDVFVEACNESPKVNGVRLAPD